MAVSEEQKKLDIAEAQKFLRAVAKSKGEIPEVIPDGIYGKETKRAVSEFQRTGGLPVTGQIDSETWDALYSAYKEAMENLAPCKGIHPFAGKERISEGYGGYPVYIVQAMINTVSQFYDNIDGVKINGIYDTETAGQIKNLQEIMCCSADGEIDKRTWNCLARLYNFHAAMDEGENIPMEKTAANEAPEAGIHKCVG